MWRYWKNWHECEDQFLGYEVCKAKKQAFSTSRNGYSDDEEVISLGSAVQAHAIATGINTGSKHLRIEQRWSCGKDANMIQGWTRALAALAFHTFAHSEMLQRWRHVVVMTAGWKYEVAAM